MIRAVIVDDELHAREELAFLLGQTGEFEVAGICANALEALKVVHRQHPDVLFLDVQMPVLNGFELLAMIDRDIMPHVVFVTAYDEFALKAFEEKTLDYLLKPVQGARLAKTVARIKEALAGNLRPTYPAAEIDRIPCLRCNKIKLVDARQVEFVRSDPSGIHIVTAEGEFHTEITLKVLESRRDWFRCHKQYLVSLPQVDEIILLEGGLAQIRTRSGQHLPVSRRYLKALREKLHF